MTTAVLRPNGTTFAGTVTGAASAHAATNDDSDSSYVTQAMSDNAMLLQLGTTTLPAGSVTKYLRLRARVSTASLISLDLRVVLTPIAGTTTSIVGGSITTHTGPYAPVTLTQADVDALNIYGSTTLGSPRLHELYADLVYVTQPVVTLAAITDPYTTSTQIACSWTNTLDSDGGGQTAYQLWVTDDNNSNAVVYDSGIVASSATSASTGPLAPDGEYTVHIKVAQTVNGAYHWSAEDTQADVDLDVNDAGITSVTFVANDTAAKNTVTVVWNITTETPQAIEVERSSDDGATWVPVRGATVVAWTGASNFVVDDYEAPNGVDVVYRARAILWSGGYAIAGHWGSSDPTGLPSWKSTDVWFKVPGAPNLNDTFCFKVLPSNSRPMRYGQFPVLGAARPVVVTDVRSSPDAQCAVQTESEADADAFLTVVSEPVVLIQTPAGFKRWGSRYVAVRNLNENPLLGGEQAWNLSGYAVWSFDAIEVDAPGDPDAGVM